MKCCNVSNPFDSFSSVIHYVEKERPNSDGSIMTLSQTDSDTINIVRCGMNETEMCVGLSLSNVMIQGGEGDFVIIWRLNV
ncbi:MAG: hypothetical protein EZS28_006961 [Streblomastix strix]|uniref:Uncharacterized protein n=1 Tax=Streblomastix strix TaxID=222440 RepID=A0A5J4WRH0_9EUKA|nr:MAG: hypothetical protein EZS28_006961 [Streblomastix strix]